LPDTTGTNIHGCIPLYPDGPAVLVDPTTGIPIQKVVLFKIDMGGLAALKTAAIDLDGR